MSAQWRANLAGLLAQTAPGAPTLCEGWNAKDLAAHLVMRERRPDAAPGLVVPALRGVTERVRRSYLGTDYTRLVELFAAGPPPWSPFALPPLEQAANPVEFFVHAEDVGRAAAGPPQQVDDALGRALWSRLRGFTLLLRRRAPVAFVLTDGERELQVGSGAVQVRVSGKIGELTLFALGRGSVADVQFDGPAAAVAALRAARFGL